MSVWIYSKTSHSKTLIDNIFSNFISPEIISGNITATISDHLPQFSFVPNILSNPSTQKSNYYERDWSKFKQENFILDYFDKDWADLLQIDQQNVNLSMDSFLNNINSILDSNPQPVRVFVYELSGCGFESSCSHFTFRFRACFEQGVP